MHKSRCAQGQRCCCPKLERFAGWCNPKEPTSAAKEAAKVGYPSFREVMSADYFTTHPCVDLHLRVAAVKVEFAEASLARAF